MNLWNKLATAGRDRNADDRHTPQSDDAIYLTDQAARSDATTPAIRFPLIGRSYRHSSRTPAPDKPARRTLLQWLGFRRAQSAEQDYGPTLIRKPKEAPRPAGPAAARTTNPTQGALPGSLPRAATEGKPPRRKKDRSDFLVGALGLTLGLTCALFPWYIFFNQEKFGVREFVFDGNRSTNSPDRLAYQPQLVGEHFTTGDLPRMDLDFLPTATLRDRDDPARAVPASEQPFPSDLVPFRLVHIANGRAMIEDEDGLWVVQPGARLPDASKVASIEQRDGRWVLVTTLDRVVELTP